MGFVTTGKSLTENHPFFRTLAHGDDPSLRQQVAKFAPGHSDAVGHEEEEEEEDQDDEDDEEFVPAVEHVDSSESENEMSESADDDDDDYEDAEED